MACVKLGSKGDAFHRQGQAWFCTTGLPSDVVVEVEEMSFHLHKFPLLSRSGVMEKLIAEASEQEAAAEAESESSESEQRGCVIKLPEIPGGPKTFELVARFCYGVKLELTASNVAYLRCAAELLEMTEDYGDGNLVTQTENFLTQVVLRSWKDSLKTLQTCGEILAPAEELGVTKRCIEALATRASTDPNLFGWPIREHGGPMQSPGGSLLWNGISTGARPKNSSLDWWYGDASALTFPLYKRLIEAMGSRGIKEDIVAGSITFYAKKYLPGLNRHESGGGGGRVGPAAVLSEEDQKLLLEEFDRLLPAQKGLVQTKFLFGLLRTAMILKASPACVSSLERRIGMQLDQATLEDLLMPNFSNTMETLYNVDCVQRILGHFLAMDRAVGGESPCSIDDDEDDGRLIGSPSLTPITMVAKLVDGYLAEVAPDVNLKPPKFQELAVAVPEFARPLDDGLYRAIDIFLKSHPWLAESDREQICRLMDCQKLSVEACTHAAQNERLPLRVVVQVLFFEQLQLRTSIAGCFLVSENLDGSRPLRSGGGAGPAGPTAAATEGGGGWATAVRENQVLKVGMDNMRMRVSELEKECSSMRQEIEKLGKGKGGGGGGGGGSSSSSPLLSASGAWGSVSKKFGFKIKSQMCSAEQGSVSEQKNHHGSTTGKAEKLKDRRGKHKRASSKDD